MEFRKRKCLLGSFGLALSIGILCLLDKASVSPIMEQAVHLGRVAGRAELTVPFVKNEGQFADASVKYAASIFKGAAFVKDTGVVYSLMAEGDSPKPKQLNSYLEAMATREEPALSSKVVAFEIGYSNGVGIEPKGKVPSATRVSSYHGRDAKAWKQGIESYDAVSLGEVWQGVEVELRAHENNVEQLFYVKPSALPEAISLSFKGIDSLSIDERGELVIAHEGGKFALTKPVAYQVQGGKREDVQVAYHLDGGFVAGFSVGNYDRDEILIIDPLLAATYLGGTDEERYAYEGFGGHIYAGDRAIARDASGNVFLISQSRSNNFPTTVGVYDGTYNDASSYLKNDLVISKLSPGLDTLLASTYLGGTSEDNAGGLALDNSGDVYITGFTRSMDFPVLNGEHDISYNGGASDVFVAKLSGDLTTLLGSTYLGGSSAETAYSLVLDGAGSLYLVGDTSSNNFPTRSGGYQTTKGVGTDAFVARMSTDLATLSNVTFLGGGGEDYGRALLRATSGVIYAIVNTTSADYPTTIGAYDRTQNGRLDVAVSMLSADLSTLSASTVMGDVYDDVAYTVALDLSGNLVLGGMTESTNFPTTVGAYDRSHNGVYDAYVAKLGANLNNLVVSTFVGGSNWEDVYSIGVNSLDEVFLLGSTRSSNYPTTAEVYKTTLDGTSDGFITKFSGNLATVQASTLMGGSGHLDAMLSFVFDSAEDLMTVGVSNSANFPTTPGAYATTARGARDMVVFLITKNLLADTSSSHLEVYDSIGNHSLSMVAGSSQSITVKVFDQNGNVLPSYHGDYNVIFSGPAQSAFGNLATCTNKSGAAVNFGSATQLTFNKGVASCVLRTYKAELTTVDASISTLLSSSGDPSYDLDLNVTPGALSASGSFLSVSPSPATVQSPVGLGLSVNDLYGNPIGAAGTGQTVTFHIAGANTQIVSGSDNGNSTYSSNYTPINSGYDAITARVNNNPVSKDGEGTSDGTYNLTVNSLGLDHLEVRYQSPPLTYNSSASFQAGSSYTLDIFARDALGNNVMVYDGWKVLVLSGPTLAPYGGAPTCSNAYGQDVNIGQNTVLNFVDGKASCTFKPKRLETVSVDISDATVNTYGSTVYDLDIVVGPASVSHLVVTGSITQVAGSPQIVTLTAKDAFGNIHPSYTGDRYITFSGAAVSYNGTISVVADKDGSLVNFGAQTLLTFNAGVVTASMKIFARGVAEIDVTDGTSSSTGSPNYDLNVNVSSTGVPVAGQSTLETSANPVGSCGLVGVTARVRDLYGNQLESGGQTVVINIAGANAGSPLAVDNNDGSFLAQYAPNNAGADQITGTINGGAMGKDLDGTSDGTFHETINVEATNTAVWLGGTNAWWHIPSNWQGGVVPQTCYDVVINGDYTNAPIIDHTVSGRVVVRNLTLGSSKTSLLTQSNAGSTNYLQVRNDFTIGAYGTLTHSVNPVVPLHQTYVVVNGNMTVGLNGKINVTGLGYPDRTTNAVGYGPGGGGAGQYPSGGAHGGTGGLGSAGAASNSTYGSLTQPSIWGSSGGGYSPTERGKAGGGVVRLIVEGNSVINGDILADGASDLSGQRGSGGAGGSIWITSGQFSGTGNLSVNGGSTTTAGNGGGGGGGGRLAVYYGSNNFSGVLRGYGAAGYLTAYAGAGTIYLKDNSQPYGSLVVDNNSHNGQVTRGVAGTVLTFSNMAVRNGAYYQIVASESLTNLASTWGDNGTVEIQSGGYLFANNLTTLSNLTVVNSSTLSLPQLSTISAINFTNNGIYNHSSGTLAVNGASSWVENGSLKTIGDTTPVQDIIVTNATLEFRNQSDISATSFNSLTVNNGGVVTHKVNGTSPDSSLYMVLGTLAINGTGKIDVSARGYQSQTNSYTTGYGPGGGTGGQYASGGTHGGGGGLGSVGSNTNVSYGSIAWPTTFGSSGGGGFSPPDITGWSGGGVVRLTVSGPATINGSIIADGASDLTTNRNSGGAGGSILLDIGQIAGSGTISVNGGSVYSLSNGGGGGGGGRVAIHYAANSYGGVVRSYGGIGYQSAYGGAGTVYLKDKAQPYGTLVVDNNNHAGQPTKGVAGDSYTLQNMFVQNGGYYQIVSGQQLTLMQSTWSDNGTVEILAGGQLVASNLTSLSNIKIINGSTLNLPSLSSMSGITFTNNGVYNHSGTTLTVNNGTTWVENGTLRNIGNTTVVSNLVVTNGTLEFGNQTASLSTTFNSLTIGSGGVVRHAANGTTPTVSLNLILGSLTISSGGKIDVGARGYPESTSGNGYGPGAGTSTCCFSSSGGTHGGVGAARSSYPGSLNTNTYGSITQPVTFGSSAGATVGRAGGGVVRLQVSGLLDLSGSILAQGGSGTGNVDTGGAGGSIWLDVGTISGAGVISVDGGIPNNATGAGGGGGRVALYYNTNNFTGAITAYGASGSAGYSGAGTVFLKDKAQPKGTLFIKNNGTLGQYTDIPVGNSDSYSAIYVQAGGYFRIKPSTTFSADLIDVYTSGIMELATFTTTTKALLGDIHLRAGGALRHADNSTTQANTVNIRANNLTIDAGGYVDTTGYGYDAGNGAGTGSSNSGAGYGGNGGNGTTGAGGTNYGNMLKPLDLGSGATGGGAGTGGGAMRIQVDNLLTLNGELRAKGNNGTSNIGGGAGGSVLLTANILAGTGYVTANGGNGQGNGAGGGGGRIAVYYFGQSFITDGGHITSATPGQYTDPVGGTGFRSGNVGTLYMSYPHHYILSGNTTQNAGASQVLTITLIDNNGNPFIWEGTRNITLSGATVSDKGNPATCVDRMGNAIPFGSPMALDFADGTATCSMTIYKVGTHEVDLDDGSYNSFANPAWDLDVTVSGGNSGSVLYSTLSANKTAAFVGEPINTQVTLYDDYGNRIYIGSATVTMNITGANPQVLAVNNVGNGTYTASYTPAVSGVDAIRATVNGGSVMDDTDGVPDGVFHVAVSAGPADHLTVTGSPSQIAGSAQTITIRAIGPGGGPDGSYNGTMNILLSGAGVSLYGNAPTCRDRNGVDRVFGSATALDFVAGVATCQMYLYKAENTSIDASDGTLNSYGNAAWDLDVAVTINQAGSAQGIISAGPNPAVENDNIVASLQATDVYGNYWAKTGLNVVLLVLGPNSGALAVSDNGDGTYSASYSAVNIGTDQIRGAVNNTGVLYDTDGLSDGVYNLAVQAAVVSHHFELTGSGTQVAGASQQVTIMAKGSSGTTSPSYRGVKTVTLVGGLTAAKGQVPTCTDRNGVAIQMNVPMSLNFTNGVAHCDMVLYRSGAQSIDGSDGSISSAGDPAWDLDVVVSATVVDSASAYLTGSATSVNTKDTVVATVYGRDQYGNNVSSGGATVTVMVSGSNPQALAVTDHGNGLYTGSYLARNAGADQLRGEFDGVNITTDGDGVSDGVFNITISDTITATHLEVKGLSVQEAGAFQTITIQALDDQSFRDFGFQGTKMVKLSGASPTTTNSKPGCLDKYGKVKTFGTLTALDFVNGQANCQMVLYKLETAHVDAESGVLNSFADPDFDLDVDVQPSGTGVASALVDARPNPVVVNGTVTVTITTLDEYGNQTYDVGTVLTATVGGANPRILVLNDEGDGTYKATYQAIVSGVDNITGTLNSDPITADTDGISNGVYVLRVISEGFADHLEITGANVQDVGSSQIISIAAKMLGGQTDVSYEGVHEITLSGANTAPIGTAPTCRDRNGVDRILGVGTELLFASGVASCRLYLYKAELAVIDGSDGVISTVGDEAWDLDVTVGINPGGVAQGRISGSVTTAIENEVVGISVQATDAYGNDWAKTGLAILLNVTGANTLNLTVTDQGDGTYAATYAASGVGADLVRGTINAQALLYDTDGTSDGVYHITVLAGIVPHHFEVTGLGAQVSGSSQNISITARAVTGEVAPSYRGDKLITLSGGLASLKNQVPTCTDKNGAAVNLGSAGVLTFNNGVATCSLVLYRSGVQSIDSTDGLLSSAGDELWDLDVAVGVGAVSNAAAYLVGSSTNINTKDTETVTVYARDASWNSINVGGASVTLAVSGANAGSLAVVDRGDGSYTASYVGQSPGPDAIRGTFNSEVIAQDNEGLSDGVYHLVVADTIVANHLEITGSPTQMSGTFQTIVISARDSAGYRAHSYSGVKTLKLSGANKSPAGFKPACLDISGAIKPFGAATVLQFVEGQASCLMVLYQLELAHIDAADNGTSLSSMGNESWDLDVLVQANSGDSQGGVISAAPSPAQMGSMIGISVSISDSFGNSVSSTGLNVTLDVSGVNAQNLTVIDNHDGTYSAQYVAAHHGIDFIEGAINGEPITADTDGTSDGTFQLTILPLNSLLSAKPSPAEKGKEVIVEVSVTGTGGGVVVTGLPVSIAIAGANPGSHVASDVGGGKYRAKYTATSEGVDFITGTVDSALIKADTDGVSDGIFQLPVVGNRGAGGGRFIAGVARYESSSGRPAIGVDVTAGSLGTGTNQYGYYVIYDVPNGTYTLGGSKSGYSVFAEPGVNPVTVNDAPVVNANLIVSASVPVEVLAPWNSFLGHFVIGEIFNSGTDPLTAELTMYRQAGSRSEADPEKLLVRIPVQQQRDIILNSMKGFQLDTYGVLRIKFSHPYYSGQVSYYKVRPGEIGFRENADQLKKEFDYALANPFVGPSYGTSYVIFNTHQVSGKADDLEKLVPNWLTVVNGSETSSEWFAIKKYDETGKLLTPTSTIGMPNCALKAGVMRCKIPHLGRIDVDGGHVFPGPARSGLVEIIPDNKQLSYSANLIRYGMGAPPTVYTDRYDFAVYLQARAGSFKEQVMPISTTSGAENWLELANVSDAKQTVMAEYYYYDGEFAGAQNFKLGPKGQVHVNVEAIIGRGNSGVVKLSGQGSNGVIAHNLSYYRLDDRSAYAVTGTQSAEPNRSRIAGTYNRFLNMSNWLRIVNLTSKTRNVTLKLHVNQKEQDFAYTLQPYGGVDVPLHDAKYDIPKNTLGMFEVVNDEPGAIFSQMYRMKHADAAPFDFVMPTEVR